LIIKNWQIFLFAIVLVLVMFLCNKYCSQKYDVVGTSSDTTKTTTTRITTTVNSFSIEQIGKIKRHLIDSLSAFYKLRIKALTKVQTIKNSENTQDSSSFKNYVFLSEIDTNFVAKDSTGRVTDSTHVKSTFMSSIPLPENSIHFLSMTQKSFNKETETITTITNTKIVEKKKSFFNRFKIVPNISAGYGITSRMFDVYAGVGVTFEF